MKAKNVMLDIETLADYPSAIILSIGAVTFDIKKDGTELGEKFYVNIDGKTAAKAGLIATSATVDWWAKQSKEARAVLEVDMQPITTAFEQFNAWWKENTTINTQAWSNGTNFDFPILEYAFRKCGMSTPWSYRRIMDFRTIVNLFGMEPAWREYAGKNNNVLHNAANDAACQAMFLGNLLKGSL
jgi:hypothetical protein